MPNTIDHAYDLEYFLAIYRTSFADVRAITTTGQGEYMWHNTDDYYSVALIDEKQDVTRFYEKEMYEGVTQIEKWVIGEKEYYLDSEEGATVWPRGQLTLSDLALRSLPTPLALFGIPLYLELEKEMTFELEFRVTYSEKGNLFILEMFEGEDAEAGLYYYYIENGRFSKTEGDLPYNIENNYFYDLSDIPESPPLPDIEWNEVFATDLIR